jgi:hypothetical protein
MWIDRALTGTVDDFVEQRLLRNVLDRRCSTLPHEENRSA